MRGKPSRIAEHLWDFLELMCRGNFLLYTMVTMMNSQNKEGYRLLLVLTCQQMKLSARIGCHLIVLLVKLLQ